MVQKIGKTTGSTSKRSGVYILPLTPTSTGYSQPYYGRTNRSLEVRLSEHRKTTTDMTDQTSALVVHKQTYPGNMFDFDAARIIWKNNDKLESKMVESACIQQLPSCNIGCGEVSIGSIMVSAINKITNLQQSNSSANR